MPAFGDAELQAVLPLARNGQLVMLPVLGLSQVDGGFGDTCVLQQLPASPADARTSSAVSR
jgi:hypothetical protein